MLSSQTMQQQQQQHQVPPPVSSVVDWNESLLRLSEASWNVALATLKRQGSTSPGVFPKLTRLQVTELPDETEDGISVLQVADRLREVLDLCSTSSSTLKQLSLHACYAAHLRGTFPAHLQEVEIEALPEENNQESEIHPSLADVLVHQLLSLNHVERIALTGSDNVDDFPCVSSRTILKCFASPHLKCLELKGMQVIVHHEAPPRRLGQAVRCNKWLELIRVRCGRVPEPILLEIGQALQEENRTLQYVDIGSVEGVTDAVAQRFTAIMASGNTTFRSLECNLNGVSNFNYMSLKHMFCMDISDNLIGDEGCLVLAKCLPGSSIERINLAENGIHRLGASAIAWGVARAKCLKIVNICDNPVLQEGPAVHVASADVRAVMNQVQGHSAYAHGFVGMLCAALQDHPNMEHLNLASTGLSDAQGTLVALLARISSLQTLILGRNNLGDETCGHLYSVLGDGMSRLSSLSLQVNSFTALGFYTLWHGVLRTNDSLRHLNVGLRTYDINGVSRGQKDIDIALRLNKAGRVRLLKDRKATAKDWLECLFTVADDIDCSYTLLRENPALVEQ